MNEQQIIQIINTITEKVYERVVSTLPSEESITPTAFELRFMKGYTLATPVDHGLFREFIRMCTIDSMRLLNVLSQEQMEDIISHYPESTTEDYEGFLIDGENIKYFYKEFRDIIEEQVSPLSTAITAETQRATNAEGVITNALYTETQRAQGVETSLNAAIATKIGDAPSDGNEYARKNGQWAKIEGGGGGGIPEAPKDGKVYGRKNGEWVEAADENLREDLDAEIERAKSAEDDLETAINNETTARTSGDTTNANAIAAEAARAQGVESTLSNKIDSIAPEEDGEAGQVLTLDEDGNPVWSTPAVGGSEVVNLQLAVATGTGSVAGVDIAVTVEGENVPRELTTDENGRCRFSVSHGLQYIIAFGTIEGYLPVESMTYRASLNVRQLTSVYYQDVTVTQEHVTVELYYTSEGAARAATVSVQTDSGTTSHAVVNNKCEFDVPLGTNYVIKFAAVDGFTTPANQSFTATFRARRTMVYYVGAVTGLAWVRKDDGSTAAFNDITLANCDEFVGLRISSSLLAQQSASYIVPIEYLIEANVVRSGQTVITRVAMPTRQWGPQQQLDSLPFYTSASAATTPDQYRNLDGENNTSVYLAEAATKGITLGAMSYCRGLSWTINGVTKYGFCGSYAQLKALADNSPNIDTLLFGVLGVHGHNFKSGYVWSSTQNSPTNGVSLGNGGFGNGAKTSNYSTVPFIAY